jgi:maltose O-acetyltransferase
MSASVQDAPLVRGRLVTARLWELREAPELLARWAESFTDADDLTLVVLADPGDESGTAWLQGAAGALGLERAGAPDVLVLAAGAGEAPEAPDGRLSVHHDDSGTGTPALGLIGEPAALRERVLLPPVSGAQAERVEAMRRRWDCARVSGRPDLRQPVLLTGPGRIDIADGATFGWARSPGFHSGYVYVEAGLPESVVEIGRGCLVNNDACIRSEGPGITIGRDVLIGNGAHVYDSDFHAIDPWARAAGQPPRTAAVTIGDGAWIGANAMVLKGVTVGAGAVVGAGSVVTQSVPPATLAAGSPARVVRTLESTEPVPAGA